MKKRNFSFEKLMYEKGETLIIAFLLGLAILGAIIGGIFPGKERLANAIIGSLIGGAAIPLVVLLIYSVFDIINGIKNQK